MRTDVNSQLILLVEDEPEVRSYIEMALRCDGFRVETAEDGDEGLQCLQLGLPFSAVLLDVSMPNRDGLDVLREIRSTERNLPVIMISGTASSGVIVEAMRAGANDFLGKPVSHESLRRALTNILGDSVPETPKAEPSSRSADLFFGSSPSMQALRNIIPLVAFSEAPVLIQGETGVGKEVLARYLHSFSQRARKPFLKLNCAALPSELVESELFGYERGAFTGAYQRKPGMFEIADGGTLLLDEIGDMDFKLQAKLLQVLQDHEFQRLGGKETVRVDVRVIAATHSDLEKAIASGAFRPDLFYRLNVVSLFVPPLRELRDDVVPFAEFLVKRHCSDPSWDPEITPELKHALLLHDWPGNVRELDNVIRKYAVLRDPDAIIRDLATRATRKTFAGTSGQERATAVMASAETPAILDQVTRSKAQAETEAIVAALSTTRWNRKKAAALLRIDYKALLYKMKKLGIDGNSPAENGIATAIDAQQAPSNANPVSYVQKHTAIIIGAGPAGLTAAHELLTRTDIQPIVLEMSSYMGGISRTINYKGNRIDIGGHRFFSKSDRVMNWWLNFLPLESVEDSAVEITYQRRTRSLAASGAAPDAAQQDRVMLLRNRLSRIYFLRRFFTYPITLSVDTLRKLGLVKTAWIGVSYLRSLAFPIRPEENLEQFFINRFGRKLYNTFFKSYTEKVWGVPCDQISAEWGAQRIKGLSVYQTLMHILRKLVPRGAADISQKNTETSLIERFLYPKFGPGQMWEEVARQVTEKGGEILSGWRVEKLEHADHCRITAVWAANTATGERRRLAGDFFFSTMPVRELIAGLDPAAPDAVREVAEGLIYRDFITVGLLCRRLKVEDGSGGNIRDNWIYIQEPDVLVGRLQIFNNWSPYMVADPETVWVGLEYFCNETDLLWRKPDAELIQLGKEELSKLGMLDPGDALDATVIRMPKAYPAYFGTYSRFQEIADYTDRFENLFLVGRNGMHRYNNQDHSMLAAMTAVDNIIGNVTSRENLWALNTEEDYHEEKITVTADAVPESAAAQSGA